MAKRKWTTCEQSRAFQISWEEEYFVVENCGKNSVTCLICKSEVSGFKRSNLERHFKSKHRGYSASGPIGSALRKRTLDNLKQGFQKQKSLFTSQNDESDASFEASLRVTELLCKHKKPFTDGEFVKEAAITLLNTVCKDDKFKDTILKKISSVPLSQQTVARRSESIASDLFQHLIQKIKNAQYFSLAIDESTDVSDTAQLCLYVRLSSECMATEEFLAILALEGRTTGEIIGKALIDFMKKWDLPTEKLLSIATDGARAMTGEKKGCVAILKDSGLFPNLKVAVHCLIHQENLCSKHANIERVMIFVQKTVNFVKKSSSLTHRQFKLLLKESDSVAPDLLLYTEVRWLSRSAVLDRFCSVLDELKTFLQEKNKDISLFDDVNWLGDLFFLTDISSHLATLNKSLQGRDNLVTDLYSAITGFRKKLDLLSVDLLDSRHMFPRLAKLVLSSPNISLVQYSTIVQDLINEFARRFKDVSALEPVFTFLVDPFQCEPMQTAKELCDFSKADFSTVCSEICNLQSSIQLRSAHSHTNKLTCFWTLVPDEQYPVLRDIVNQVVVIFGSTYCCEATFSQMRYIKSRYRAALGNVHLDNLLRISSTAMVPDYNKLLKDRHQTHQSH